MQNADLAALHRERLERGSGKQSTTFRFRGQDVLVVEDHGRCLGSSAWESSFHLAKFLAMDGSFTTPASGTFSAIELGCGIGLPGICAARLGAQVTLTDKQQVLPVTRANVEANGMGGQVHVRELVWEDALVHSGRKADKEEEKYDLVLAADVVYSPQSYDGLAATLAACTHQGSVVLLAYRQRHESDALFFRSLSEIFSLEVVWSSGPPPAILDVATLRDTSNEMMSAKGNVGAVTKIAGDWVTSNVCCIIEMRRRARPSEEPPI